MNEKKSPDQAHFRSKLKTQIAYLGLSEKRGSVGGVKFADSCLLPLI